MFQSQDLTLKRNIAVTPPAAGSELTGPAGIHLRHTLYSKLTNVSSINSSLGFLYQDAVQTKSLN